ncbi:hypothetical protein KUTeg_013192 [Tegillarca granosa]|uniref:Protein FAM98A n=1 Tax=Tegillarca granosa TaxID=220873 RepID=A0ABQ9ESZ2_TEGGR|nr:hypothetical protein KUTeg_013192 [Tegillarca granosa]
MENDILDSLEDLGYSGPLLEEDKFNVALEQGPRSPDYTQLVSWLTESIRLFCGVEEQVNAITSCPYKVLSDGPVNNDNNKNEWAGEVLFCSFLDIIKKVFLTKSKYLSQKCIHKNLLPKEQCVNRKQKLMNTFDHFLIKYDFLTTELASVKMLSVTKPASLKVVDPSAKPSDDAESDTAKHLKMMLIALGFPKPPANITTFQLFSKVESKVKEIVTKDPSQIGKPLLKVRLSDKQWEQVLRINDSLLKEYQLRREMLLKRLDQKQDKIAEIYQPLRKALTAKCNVGVGRILSARDDLTRIEKTSSGEGRVKCALNKVPDRGGRAWEHEPPPPEMPAFQKRGRGGGHGGRGGKVQGGWGDSSGGNVGGQWSQGGGGHRGGGQGYNPSYNQGGGGYSQSYQGGGGGRGGGHHGGGGYQGGGGGYNQGYQQGGGGYNQGGYQDYNQDRRGGGRGGSARGRGRGGRGGR